jgi:N utilization substance protein B
MGTRRKSRELVVQMLFQMDLGKQTPEHVRQTFWSERSDVDAETRGFAEDIFRAASQAEAGPAPQVDGLIEKHAANWRLDRMAAVDRNVLRAAVAEMIAFPKTPRPVVINEAIEIARKFSAPDSVNFINGVLDSVAKEL